MMWIASNIPLQAEEALLAVESSFDHEDFHAPSCLQPGRCCVVGCNTIAGPMGGVLIVQLVGASAKSRLFVDEFQINLMDVKCS